MAGFNHVAAVYLRERDALPEPRPREHSPPGNRHPGVEAIFEVPGGRSWLGSCRRQYADRHRSEQTISWNRRGSLHSNVRYTDIHIDSRFKSRNVWISVAKSAGPREFHHDN